MHNVLQASKLKKIEFALQILCEIMNKNKEIRGRRKDIDILVFNAGTERPQRSLTQKQGR